MRLYLRSRRVLLNALLVLLISAVNLACGPRVLTVLSGHPGGTVPYRSVLGLFAAVLLVAGLDSPVPGVDQGDTGPLRRARAWHAGVGALAGAVLIGAGNLPDGGAAALSGVRAFITWYALAALSALIAGAGLSWIAPLAGLALIVWCGTPDSEPAAWNWITAPAGQPLTWLPALGVLAAAVFIGGSYSKLRLRQIRV